MNSHITGNRAKLGYGAVVSMNIASAIFGTTPSGTTLILETEGATPTTPLMVRITGHIPTAFDGQGAVFTLQQTDLDGGNATSLATIAGFTAGKFSLSFILTSNKRFNLVYAGNTAGGDVTVTDGVMNSDTSLVSATAAFVAGDVGKTVTGTGIPASTTIASRTNATTVVLSQATTVTGTGKTFVIEDRTPGTAGEGHYAIEIAGKGNPSQD